ERAVLASVTHGRVITRIGSERKGTEHAAGGGSAAGGGVETSAETRQRGRPKNGSVRQGGEVDRIAAGVTRRCLHFVEMPEMQGMAVGGIGLKGFIRIRDTIAIC